tara:strand:- start:37 stop:459 length:423 start_codon:yes stop_codon:yes gene_type:complete
MSSIFTRIINEEVPGRIFWRDKTCVAIVDIRPINRGHTLVIPIEETDQWTDLPLETVSHCLQIAYVIAQAQKALFLPERIALLIAGFEVPHAHLHLIPANGMEHLDFNNANPDANDGDLDQVADLLRSSLKQSGYESVVS